MNYRMCNKNILTKVFPIFIIIIVTICFFCYRTSWANVPNRKQRAIAVMIGNSHQEREVQKGLSDADVIYEIEVEFPFTRLMAFFHGNADTVVGPVRSSRYYFSRICAEWSAIFAHCGGQSLKNANVWDIDQMYYQSPYWRDEKIGGWINLFTITTKLRQAAIKHNKSVSNNQNKHNLLIFSESESNDGGQIGKITIKVHSDYIISYEYHADQNNYYRYVNQKPHIDQGNLEQIKVSNIIIQYTNIEKIDGDNKGRVNVELIGEGIGGVFNRGSYQSIKWIKKTKDDQTQFLDGNGNPIVYDPGVTWIHVLSTDNEIWFK